MRSLLLLTLILSGCGGTSAPAPDRAIQISDFVTALNASGLTVEEQNGNLIHEIWKAADGGWITIDGNKFSVLEYDCSVTTGREGLAAIKADGMHGSAMIASSNLVIKKKDPHPRWSEIVEVFKGL